MAPAKLRGPYSVTAEGVTQIWTDYGGYWTASTSNAPGGADSYIDAILSLGVLDAESNFLVVSRLNSVRHASIFMARNTRAELLSVN